MHTPEWGGSSLSSTSEVHQRRIGCISFTDFKLSSYFWEDKKESFLLREAKESQSPNGVRVERRIATNCNHHTEWNFHTRDCIRKTELLEKYSSQAISMTSSCLPSCESNWLEYPRSLIQITEIANAKHFLQPWKFTRNHGGELAGVLPSLLGNLFKMTAEQCSYSIEVRARQVHWKFEHFKGYGRETKGLVFGTGATTGATMGSRTGVVIGSGPTGGWTGAVLCEQEGCTWSFVTSVADVLMKNWAPPQETQLISTALRQFKELVKQLWWKEFVLTFGTTALARVTDNLGTCSSMILNILEAILSKKVPPLRSSMKFYDH
ncbi:hypothetical protein Tco_0262110 [Tanacetum coccineum]